MYNQFCGVLALSSELGSKPPNPSLCQSTANGDSISKFGQLERRMKLPLLMLTKLLHPRTFTSEPYKKIQQRSHLLRLLMRHSEPIAAADVEKAMRSTDTYR